MVLMMMMTGTYDDLESSVLLFLLLSIPMQIHTWVTATDMLENNAQATFMEISTFFFCTSTVFSCIMLARNGLSYVYNDGEQTQPSTQHGPSMNTCHTYLDLVSLTKAIHKNLGLEGSSSAALLVGRSASTFLQPPPPPPTSTNES